MKFIKTIWCLVFLLALVGCPQKKAQNTVQQPSQPKPISPTSIFANKDVAPPIVPMKSLSVEELIAILKSGTEAKYRAEAVRILGEIKDPRVVEPLIEALKDENYMVKIMAVGALVSIKDPRAIEPLMALLPDSRIETYSIVKMLGEMGDPRAVEPLIGHIKDIDDKYGELEETIKALGKLNDPREVEPLISLLKEKITAWEFPDEIIKALGSLNDTRAVEPLIDAMKRFRRPHHQALAAEALCKLKDPRAVEPIITTLIPLCNIDRHEHNIGFHLIDEAPIRIAQVFGQLKDPRTVIPLTVFLTGTSLNLQAETAKALVEINDPRAITPLVNTLYTFHVSTETLLALNHFGWQPPSIKDKVFYLIVKKDKDQLLRMWPDTKKTLLEAIDSGNSLLYQKALEVFIALGNEDIIPDLVNLIDVKDRGDLPLTTIYYESGRKELVDAARRWRKKIGEDDSDSTPGSNWGKWE